jgi:small subunit ribosomal protein S4e
MATHGETKSIKRSQAPKFLRAPRKKYKYLSKPLPGRHRKDEAITLLSLIRDVMKIASNATEAKYIIKQITVKVNGKRVTEHKFNVGFSDIVEIDNDKYLVWLDEHSKYTVIPLSKREKMEKVVKIDTFRGNKKVFRFHDGANYVDMLNALNANINDTVVFDLDTGKITKVIAFRAGTKVIIFRGRKAGYSGELISVGKTESKIKTSSGEILTAPSLDCLAYE